MRPTHLAVGCLTFLATACMAPAPPVDPAPPTLVPTALATVPGTPIPPTDTPPAATATPAPPLAAIVPTATPTLLPTVAPPTPSAVPSGPTPMPNATLTAQQRYCQAAAPDPLPMPLTSSTIRIPVPAAPTSPTQVASGPRSEQLESPPRITARHVAVLDEASGRLLFEHDAYLRVAPASVTKIVTTIVALERQPDLTAPITTTVSAGAMVACDASSVMGLEPNEHVTLRTLLYGMMLPSGNDAAEQVAVSLAGSRERYVGWMNEKINSLGLRDTHFVTPSGMDADGHYSSAYDMALLARDAMRNPDFRAMAAAPRFTGDDYFMHNLNPLITSYGGADGVKIGFTDIAGRTIVASATRDGHRVYVSLMRSTNLHGDAVALFEWVWKTFAW